MSGTDAFQLPAPVVVKCRREGVPLRQGCPAELGCKFNGYRHFVRRRKSAQFQAAIDARSLKGKFMRRNVGSGFHRLVRKIAEGPSIRPGHRDRDVRRREGRQPGRSFDVEMSPGRCQGTAMVGERLDERVHDADEVIGGPHATAERDLIAERLPDPGGPGGGCVPRATDRQRRGGFRVPARESSTRHDGVTFCCGRANA